MLAGPFVYNVEIIRVIDADTIECMVDLGFKCFKREKIRLENIDTPETYRPSCEAEREHGLEATAFVEEWLKDRKILLRSSKHGKYRWVGSFFRDEGNGVHSNLAEALIANGLEKRDRY